MPKDIDKTIYIDGQFENTPINPSAFCWRPYWQSRFESLWSLLRKFAYLNAITQRETRELFRLNKVPQHSLQWMWGLRDDLRCSIGLDPLRLSTIFGIGYRDLKEATVLQYVHEREVSALTSEFLRFCPTCISQGFHSPLHQLLFLTKCPAHGDILENRCSDCLLLISYKLLPISRKDLSNCTHMLYGLSEHLTYRSVEEIRKEAAAREKALLTEAKLLMQRVELHAPEQPITQYVPPGARRRYFTRYIRRLPAYWADVFMTNSHKGSFNILKFTGKHIQIQSRKCARTSKTSSGHESIASLPVITRNALKLELFKIYKAIRRHLTRNYLLHHRRCITNVSREYLEDRIIWQATICPVVNALLLWRMFWEGVDDPQRLFWPKKPHPDWSTNPRVYWYPPARDLPACVLRRIFALECIGIFHECLLLAEALYRRNVYSLQLSYVEGRLIPHWLIEESPGDKFTIHWWVPRALSSFFGQSSSYFKSCKAKTVAIS